MGPVMSDALCVGSVTDAAESTSVFICEMGH